MTNIERYHGIRRRERKQNNYSVGFNTEAIFFQPRMPEPALADADAYKAQDLSEVPTPESSIPDSMQVILDEDPHKTDQYRLIQKFKRERKRILDEIRYQRKAAYQRLKAKYRKLIRIYVPAGFKTVTRPAVYRKVPTGETVWKTVRVLLGPRKVYRRVLVGIRNESTKHGKRSRKIFESRLVTIYPRVYRDVAVPVMKRVIVRPAMTVKRKIREMRVIDATDWSKLLPAYSAERNKIRSAYLTELADLKKKIDELKAGYASVPKLACSYSESGAVQVPSLAVNAKLGYSYCTNTGSWQLAAARNVYGYACVSPLGYRFFDTLDAYLAYVDDISKEHSISLSQFGMEPVQKTNARFHAETFADSTLVGHDEIEDRRHLAYSSVASLTNAQDYAFQWFRSTMELRDTPKTVKTATGFLKFLASKPNLKNLIKKVPNFKKASQTIAACYLSWKFAIEPTIQDVQTVLDSTVDYLLEMHRSLTKALDSMCRPSNIMHVRSAYGQKKRQVKISDVELQSSHREREISIDWILSSEPIEGHVSGGSESFFFNGFKNVPCSITPPTRDWDLSTAYLSLGDVSPRVKLTSSVLDQPLEYEYTCSSPEGPLNRFQGQTWHIDDYDGLKRAIAEAEADVSIRLPVYTASHTSGAIFAEYSVENVISVLSNDSGDLYDGIQNWLDQTLNVARRFINSLDLVKVTWELTPLSFVYDWFTNSSSIATRLANAARLNWNLQVAPYPQHGIWESRRVECLAGIPSYNIVRTEGRYYISDYAFGVLPHHQGSPQWVVAPRRVVGRTVISLEARDSRVTLRRSGLYRFRRGEAEEPDYSTFRPRFHMNLDKGKLLSLANIMVGFAGND